MAHITLSISDEMYAEMKKYTQIKWSEAAREGIRRQLFEIKGVISGKQLINSLLPDTRKTLEDLSKLPLSEWRKHYKNFNKIKRDWKNHTGDRYSRC